MRCAPCFVHASLRRRECTREWADVGRTHTRAQACAHLCAALQEALLLPWAHSRSQLGCPCPTHLASLAAATVTQGRSGSHQTGLRGEVSQFSLHR